MLLDEIKNGENFNVEFKRELPKEHKKFLKTIVAFVNGFGGKMIFGVEDSTLEIVGISGDVFKVKDAITNAIYSNIEPSIIPDVHIETIKDKTVIVVEIYPGWQKPYHIKSLGIENGTFIRVAGTTRLADAVMIKELMFEGSNRFFDKSICPEISVSDDDVDNLCDTLKMVAQGNCKDSKQRDDVELLTKTQLISWGVLIEKDNKLYPTNAYAMLVGSSVVPNTVQCALFKGNDRTEVVDMKNFSGPVYELIDFAYKFVLRNIKMKATFDGLQRNNMYELPIYAIRELLVNAVAHRSYLDRNSIKVAIYDDRLEVTSPGKLPMGQTIDKMKSGNSTIRNEALVHILQYLNYIEAWGRGVPRIIKSVREAGLKEPEFVGGETELIVNIYRNTDTDQTDQTTDQTDQTTDQTYILKDEESMVLKLISDNPEITQREISDSLGFTLSATKYYIGKLSKNGFISRVGTHRKGEWVVNKL